MTDSIERATALADAFARNVLAACARALEATPDAVLEAATGSGRPATDDTLGEAWRELARRTFPASKDAPRKLRRIVTGLAGPRPLWEDLADIESGLGVSAAELFAE